MGISSNSAKFSSEPGSLDLLQVKVTLPAHECRNIKRMKEISDFIIILKIKPFNLNVND